MTNDPHDPDLPQSYTETATVTIPEHDNGQYYLVPQVDIYQQLDATTLAANVNPDDPNDLRSDNFKAAPITILAQPPPDLVVTSIQAPAVTAAGTPYTLSWTVANQGAGATEGSQWSDFVYLSNVPTWIDPSMAIPPAVTQILLGAFPHNGALASDQSYSTQQTILLSPAYSGQYVIVVTNPPIGAPIWEGPYGNNNARTAPSVVTTAPADLQVTSVVTQPVAYSGENTTVTWTVTNFGAPVWSGTQFWYDDVWISARPHLYRQQGHAAGLFHAQRHGTAGHGRQLHHQPGRHRAAGIWQQGRSTYVLHLRRDRSIPKCDPQFGLPSPGQHRRLPGDRF